MASQTEIKPLHLGEGDTIFVQVTVLDEVKKRGNGEEKVSAFKENFSFENVTNSIEKMSAALAKTIAKVQPHKASIEFGLELATKEGQLTALLVQGSATANLTITLEWEKKSIDEKK